jgi:CHAT domain-containing protein
MIAARRRIVVFTGWTPRWLLCLLVTAPIVATPSAAHARQFGRRVPTAPERPAVPPARDLEAEFQQQLKDGKLDDAQATLKSIETTLPDETGCRVFDSIALLGSFPRIAKLLQKDADKALKANPRKATECDEARRRRAGYKVALDGARLQARSLPELTFSRPPMFVEPSAVTSLDMTLMQEQFAGLQKASMSSSPAYMSAAARVSASAEANDWEGGAAAARDMVTELRRILGDTDPTAAAFQVSLAEFEARAGRRDAALEQTRAARAVLTRAFGDDTPHQCSAFWEEGVLLSRIPDAAGAIDAAERCLRLAASLPATSITRASALSNLGLVHHLLGKLAPAVEAYRSAIQLLEQPRPVQTDAAMAQLELPQVYANLGLAYWQSGDPVSAYQVFRLAQERMKSEGELFRTERQALTALGKLSAEEDVYVTLERAAGPSAQSIRSIGLQMLLERKGLALERKSEQLAGAREAAGPPAGAAQGNMLSGFMTASLRTESEQYQALIAQRAALGQARPSSPEEAEALKRESDRLDAQIQAVEAKIGDSLRAQQIQAGDRTSPEYAAMLKEQQQAANNASKNYKDLLNEAEKRARQKKGKNATELDINLELNELMRASSQTPAMEAYLAAQQRRQQESRLGMLERIQGRLAPNAVLLEMLRYRPFTPGAATDAERWGAAHYATYVIRRDGAPVFVDFGDAAAFDADIVEFRRALSQPRGTLAHDLGRRLADQLIQPLRAHLGDADQILVSPEGLLNLVPFGALVDGQDRYLMERYSFNYLSSGRDLLRDRTPPNAPVSPALIVAAPAFGEPDTPAVNRMPPTGTTTSLSRTFNGVRFTPLPGTADEARALSQVIQGVRVLIGAAATETALKSAHRPRILHIATHGFFLEDNEATGGSPVLENPMLRSGLALAGANQLASGQDDGVLTALEAAALDLTGTRLVVLSACETGVGEVRNGEGVFGLRRAFMAAGAETLVMSLWQVDDEATRQLMVEYHRRLASGQGRVEALRQAAMVLMHDGQHSHPFYWASFISSGESSPMR